MARNLQKMKERLVIQVRFLCDGTFSLAMNSRFLNWLTLISVFQITGISTKIRVIIKMASQVIISSHNVGFRNNFQTYFVFVTSMKIKLVDIDFELSQREVCIS